MEIVIVKNGLDDKYESFVPTRAVTVAVVVIMLGVIVFAALRLGADDDENSKEKVVDTPQSRKLPPLKVDAALVNAGKRLFGHRGCVACHSLSGAKMLGPTFKGLYGSTVALKDDSTVIANDAYLAESIILPQKLIVKGYKHVPMPPSPVSDKEIKALIELIKSVR